MSKGLDFKVSWAMLKMALLMVLFLTIASGSQEPCDDVNQICEKEWNLRAEVNYGSALAYDSNGDNLVADLSAFSTDTVAFDYRNQSSSVMVQRVVTGNDTPKFIKLTANGINNDLLSYTVVGLPSHGNISGTGQNIIYVPDQGYVGNDSIVIRANDETGYLQNITVSIDVLLLYHPPSVRIRSPQNGEIFTAYAGESVAEVLIHATASGEGLTGIEFYNGLNPLVTDDNPDYFVPCATSDANCGATFIGQFYPGTYTLIAKATDGYDKTCTSLPVVITVNPSEPVVEITSPVNGEIFTSPAAITINADVTDSYAVNLVEFFANSKRIGRIENVSPYTFEWNDVKPGVYNLVAKATDELGLSSISKSVLVIVVPVKPLSKSDLALSMSSSSNPAPADGLFNYLLTVTNRGPDSATDVTVQDFLPPELELKSSKASQGDYDDSGIWSLGGLTKYRSARLVLTVQAPSDPSPGQISNTAYVYGAEVDPDNSNNHVITYTKIEARAAPVLEQNSTEINSTAV